ncbi:hypothetical protein C5B42_02170 [Candidatus Cerribacteria bacterium 'Amazon FNV 2010 28 9']|uniref:Pyridine nucleotide-disulfide oxidoreductase n=1 Tax=Candidatus Cerribacteria bacterium 'Amazon FNV 2010 28 9' TaxID=2081795 RepID=A0A317JQJ7_9BACT|nr:MAG: hypothetical protein C5B42_02170 [Candidatus Cerribacteria bacterium 'Amazon FNV 2010 28 9']
MNEATYHQVIIVGAGSGGLSVACSLQKQGINDVLVIDEGEVGQAWANYPPETHLLSETNDQKDENMIDDVPLKEVCPNIPHPSHMMYQKYLQEVVKRHELNVLSYTRVERVVRNEETENWTLFAANNTTFSCTYLVWAAGMYSTPNECLSTKHCYIHYSHIQDWSNITDKEIYVVGSANGATEVVMQLARPGRKVYLLCSKTYDIPLPIDCLWKENMQFVKDLEKQGLVDIIENFRTKDVSHDDLEYIITGEDGTIIHAPTRPIMCIGFLPNIEPVHEFVSETKDQHDAMLELDEHHESKKHTNLYFAGAIGKSTSEEGFIRGFREYAHIIAEDIKQKSDHSNK